MTQSPTIRTVGVGWKHLGKQRSFSLFTHKLICAPSSFI
eukprot:CAMPEP_0179141330 /NCGR_PEP_ID=MMETSP0796-20121207/67770_1 /TAXON_ID=73915 /ORGANISM="Pyrodinium bahamense, Strain pbaha01" /LENGTH=38 /DNA_ID= /DNA_START= /DNA_END= /DNA_ORIENTATION=